ncbi:TonB-dependent receptor domain-containing protein [Testudinibacter aquarius]|uniref:Hemoglobin/transferrin/lactoferrin receptor protein n=1 Tax=Testudinibacter aquarius TaxID=1524974 RepID=A0A4R3Y824_9PAST|nr:TonB-dependent receptor [Testudinibacter aquarius]KAE9530227.1 hypothetical protein A1D24_07100 [Testudinibacter aquarius]TCV88016.1 hemoglobin/transferrin/lactoferrin receptor protein [Testudinibacter aquarius]TNG91781.1 TonB-dependent receptor [Testudinibacter aquarius]
MNYSIISRFIALVCCGLLPATGGYTDQGSQDELQLDDLKVLGLPRTTSQKTFSIPGAVSAVGENRKMQSLDSVVRALPGTFTNINPTQGTVSVNIRGMTGFGRVNTMVDDVPQTFYGTSSNSSSKYHSENGGYGPSSQFGVMIDPNFLTGISVTRGFSQGAQGVNALNGHSNLRTIGVDDVVFADSNIGLLSKYNYGTNGLGKNAMLAVAAKQSAFDSGSIGAMLAYSGGKEKANYKRGDGTHSIQNDYVRRLDQSPRSWLAKFDLSPSALHKIELAARGYQNSVGGRQTKNSNYYLRYKFDPASPLIDFTLLGAYTDNRQLYDSDANIWQLDKAKTDNRSYYLDINNISTLHWQDFTSRLTLGSSVMTNTYAKKALGVNKDNYDYTPFSPVGRQTIYSLYLINELTYQNFTLNTGLTYVDGTVRGHKGSCHALGNSDNSFADLGCFPKNAASMKLNNKSLQPSVMLSWDLNPWFKPFISYSQSTRIPNTQEVFFNNEGSGSMNPYLKPEKAKTYQIGFNSEKENIFTDNDFLGFKLTAYVNHIKNYIHSQSFYITRSGTRITDLNHPDLYGDFHAQMYINALNPIKHRGIEIALEYDSDTLFANLSYSRQKTTLPLDVSSSIGTGFGTTSLTYLPEDYGTLTLGGRFFERDLTIGSIFKYTGKSRREVPNGLEVDKYGNDSQALPKIPIIIDLYATYRLNKHVLLKASVQNLSNKNYVDALNSLNSTGSQVGTDKDDNYVYSFTNSARGRTFLLGAEIRF